MGSERWDSERRKYVLYSGEQQHREDCRRYPFESIPRRVFLDTNVINVLVKYAGQIFDCEELPALRNQTLAHDIEALMHVFYICSRANWDIVASSKTLDELSRTGDAELREALLSYGVEVADVSRSTADPTFALDFARRLVDTAFVAALPDRADRELIGHAIGLGCDTFCTCDRATILNKRSRLRVSPLRILSPAERWAHIKPWGALWC
jgi:hypothetical protein